MEGGERWGFACKSNFEMLVLVKTTVHLAKARSRGMSGILDGIVVRVESNLPKSHGESSYLVVAVSRDDKRGR